nr:hypothetical protein CFP56_74963 [Quercus suber]
MPHFISQSDKSPAQAPNINEPQSSSPLTTLDDHEESPSQHIRIKNRRNRYLELHPEYFADPSHEIAGKPCFPPSLQQRLPSRPIISKKNNKKEADSCAKEPLVYDRLVQRFKTAREREVAGKARLASSAATNNPSVSAFAHILESSLTRSEAKLHALQHPDPANPVAYTRTPDGQILARELEPEDPEATTRADGWTQWCETLRRRFVEGRDGEFEYAAVDEDEGLDFWEERERGEAWVEGAGEEFLGDVLEGPAGETGVQDF